MPTSSVAGATKGGRVLPQAVLGRVPPRKPRDTSVGSAPSFPGKPKEPDKDHQRGPGRPPAASIESLAPAPTADDDPLDAESWGAADPRIAQQLERELRGLREQLALRQQISGARAALHATPHSGTAREEAVHDGQLNASYAFSDRSLDVVDLSTLQAPPPPIDKEEHRLNKKVSAFENLIVRKVIGKTPRLGSRSSSLLKVLMHAFQYYDSDGDGVVGPAVFNKVMIKLNVLLSLPPSPAESEVLAAIFERYAKNDPNGELAYEPFARKILKQAGALVPAEEAQAAEERSVWHYSTAVNQAMHRRNLATTTATVPPPVAREAWADHSAAVRAVEEGLAYRPQPLKDAIGAGQRGRLPGGEAGFDEFKRIENERKSALSKARRAEAKAAAADIEFSRARADEMMRESAAGWNKINERNRELRGLTPGQASAAARRMR